FGRTFAEGYLLAGNLWYFTQPVRFSKSTVSHMYYARVFIAAFFPWSLVVIGRAAQVIRRREIVPAEEWMLWAWIVVVVGFFTAARFKLDHYIFPAAPAVGILAARAWLHGERRAGPRDALVWSAAAVGAVFLI